MSTSDFNIDSFLHDSPVDESTVFGSLDLDAEGTVSAAYLEPGYEGTIDPRIRQLSYSSLLTLHSCPRKFELYRKRSTYRTEESTKSTVTFAYGHVVGEAIQLALEGRSEAEIIWKMFLGWHTDLAHTDEKLNKSFYTAVIALQRFMSLREAGFLDEYELVHYNGKPACELSFCITFPDGFRLRGFVDAVLRHKVTGQIIVLECKTTGAVTLNPESYKNSAQAIGYSVVLDVLFPDLSSYEVLYLIYQTKSLEFTPIPFSKSFLQRALWIKELLLDIETIKLYEEAEVYPMRGESCFNYSRACEYFNTCTLSTSYLTKPCTEKEVDKTEYQVDISLQDLLESQMKKMEEELS